MAKFGYIEIIAQDKRSGSIIERQYIDTTECASLKEAQRTIVAALYATYAAQMIERHDHAISEGYALNLAKADIRITCQYVGKVTAVGLDSATSTAAIGAAKSAAAKKRKARKAAKAAAAKRNASAKTKALAAGIDTSVRVSNVANVA